MHHSSVNKPKFDSTLFVRIIKACIWFGLYCFQVVLSDLSLLILKMLYIIWTRNILPQLLDDETKILKFEPKFKTHLSDKSVSKT